MGILDLVPGAQLIDIVNNNSNGDAENMRYEFLTEGYGNPTAFTFHVNDTTIPDGYDGEPMGIVFSSDNEVECRAMAAALNTAPQPSL